MSDFEKRFQANAKQAEYWNFKSGPKWVQHDDAMGSRFIPLTDELLERASPQIGRGPLVFVCAMDGDARATARKPTV